MIINDTELSNYACVLTLMLRLDLVQLLTRDQRGLVGRQRKNGFGNSQWSARCQLTSDSHTDVVTAEHVKVIEVF